MLILFGTLKALLLPPISLTILAIAGLIWERRRPWLGRLTAVTAIFLIYALSTPLVATVLQRAIQEDNTNDLTGEAIVILSAGMEQYAAEYGEDGKTTADSLTLERVRYGARLGRKTKLPIVVSGGVLMEGEPAIADIMRDILVSEYGLSTVLTERESYNTASNASLSARILKQRGISRIFLVTHAWHMKRARMVFEKQGLVVIPAGAGYCPEQTEIVLSDVIPSIKSFSKSYYALHEMIGLIEYSIIT